MNNLYNLIVSAIFAFLFFQLACLFWLFVIPFGISLLLVALFTALSILKVEISI